MILRIEDIKSCCNDILMAVDSNELSIVTETLELKTEDNYLFLNVTNREYYASVRMNMKEKEELHATVNALLFLKLISQITTETVEFKVQDNSLIIKGNGTYKLPMIYDNDKLLELPKIKIDNITEEFDISSDILNSILQYNSKQLSSGIISKPVQRMYYIDNKGAITFTSGACVNTFELEKPVKILLNTRLVKLFKLFKNKAVHFSLGYDAVNEDIIQTKVKFTTDDIAITAILSCDDSMISSVPVTAIRGRANEEYPYTIAISTNHLLETIKRLSPFMLTDNNAGCYGVFDFGNDFVTIYDLNKSNNESIYYSSEVTNLENGYSMTLDLNDLKNVLESCSSDYVTVEFGNSQAIVIIRGPIKNIIPEVSMN